MKQWPINAEDFAEETAANYIDGRYDPRAAEAARQAAQRKVADLRQSRALDWMTPAQRHRPQRPAGR